MMDCQSESNSLTKSNTKQEIEQRLEHARKDEASVKENVRDLEWQLKELNNPKPRHGDVVTCSGVKRIIVQTPDGLKAFDKSGRKLSVDVNYMYAYPHFTSCYKVQCNVFD